MAITVEELEIIIQAKVDKVVPQIRNMMKAVKKELQDSNIDFSSISKSINKEVSKAKPIVQKIKDEFDPDKIYFKIHTEDAKKQIKGVSNEIYKLKGSSSDLANAFDFSRYKQQLKNIADEVSSVSKKMKNIKENSNVKVKFHMYNKDEIQKQVEALSSKKININATPSKENNNSENKNLEDAGNKAELFKSKMEKIISTTRKVASATKTIISGIGGAVSKAGKLASSFLGIKKNADSVKNAVSQGVKQVVKYAGALIGIRSIYNGLKSLASEWMSSNDASAKQLTANLNYMKIAIGSSLKPVIETIINLIYKAISAVQSLIYAFTGVNIFAKMTAGNFKSMSKSASSASKESKQLGSIHSEINNISDSNNGGGSGDTSPDVDLSKVDTKLSDWFRNMLSDAYTFGYNVGQKINEGLQNIPWGSIQSTVQNIAYNIAMFFNGAVDGIDWSLVGYTIAQGLNTILLGAYTFLTTFNFENFGIAIGTGLNSAIANFNWQLLGQTLGAKLQAIIDTAYGILITFDFNKFGTSIATAINSWFTSVDWNKLATDFALGINGIFETAKGFIDTFDWIGTAITLAEGVNTWFSEVDWEATAQTLSDGISGILDSIIFFLATVDWGEIGASIGDFIASIDWLGIISKLSIIILEVFGGLGTAIITGVCEGISMAVVNIATFIWDNVVKPIIDAFKNLFGIHSPSTVMAELGTFIIQGLFEGISSLINKVIEIWNNLKNKTVEIINNVKEKVIEKVTNMKEKVIQKFAEIKDKVIEKATNLKNKATNTFENLKSSISSKVSNIKTSIITGFENAVNYIKSLPSQALNWGKDIIGNIVNGIKSKINDVRNAVTEVANNIKSFLHFSEPDVGPLSDFHTYMPDMIELMKKGIKDNIGSLMSTVESMADEMSYTLNIQPLNDYALATPNLGSVRSNQFRDVKRDFSNNNTISFNPTIKIGLDKDNIVDATIDGINEKTHRIGKNVIEVIDE